MNANIKNKLQLLTPGHHGCFFYNSQEQAIETSLIFLLLGLEQNERCVYLADPSTIENARIAFKLAGINVDKETERGALILTAQRDFLLNGHFDKNAMMQFIDQIYKDTLKAGFSGLRGIGDVVWEFGDDLDLEKLIDYEESIDKYFSKKKIIALCQYNLQALPPEYLRASLFSHNAVVEKAGVCLDNHFHNSLYDFPQTSFDLMCSSLHQ